MSPYIVTHRRAATAAERNAEPMRAEHVVSRRAVGFWEDVLQHASDEGWSRGLIRVLATLPESGGSIDLPDGSSFATEGIGWGELAAQAGPTARQPILAAEVLAAWNARYGVPKPVPASASSLSLKAVAPVLTDVPR